MAHRRQYALFTAVFGISLLIPAVAFAVVTTTIVRDGECSVPVTPGKVEQPRYKEGELLVRFREGVSEERKRDLHQQHGAQMLKKFPELGVHQVKLKEGMTVEEAVKLYQADPDVQYAEPNFIYTIQGAPATPGAPQ